MDYGPAHEQSQSNLLSEPLTLDDTSPLPPGLQDLLGSAIADLLLIHLEDLHEGSTSYTLNDLRYVSGGRLGNRSYFRFHVSGKAEHPNAHEKFELALSFAVDHKLKSGKF